MEIAKMNYYFTGLLVLAFTILVLFVEPAYPRNEYLNEYGARCGDFETRVEKEMRIKITEDKALVIMKETIKILV